MAPEGARRATLGVERMSDRRTSRANIRSIRTLAGLSSFGLAGLLASLGGLASLTTVPPPAAAQTIDGTLLDLSTDRPIDLGLVMIFTEAGDSIDMALTDASGRFSLEAPEPGNFLLLASALGYRETPAGVFELGEDGVMSIEYRLAPEPIAIAEVLVSLNRPVLEHKLVRNGFVRRVQRGLGAFVTPYDIERSSATSTEQLLTHIPNVQVREVRIMRQVGGELSDAELTRGLSNYGSEQFTIYPRPDIGETVQIRAPNGGWCTPTVYVDGVRTFYETDAMSYDQALTLSTIAPLETMEAIEVYRRPAEIPIEYSAGEYSAGASGTGGSCGVLVLWTKAGPIRGQTVYQAEGVGATDPGSVTGPRTSSPLPAVRASGPAPTPGERIRAQLSSEARVRLGVPSPLTGTLLALRGDEMVAEQAPLGRPVALPLSAVESLQVERARGSIHALKRGAVAGTVFGVGSWAFLSVLCRSACDSGDAWLPGVGLGLLMGALVAAQGPGTRWVQAPSPGGNPGR